MQVIVDGLLTHYERLGSGKRVVVILHGWGDSSRSWLDVARQLGQAFTVIVPDLPGFGGSAPPPSAWDLSDYAQFISHFLQKLNVDKVYTLVGHSNGGGVAIRGLAQGSLRADRLVLLASAGIRGEYNGRVKALRYATKFGKALSTPLPKSIKKRLRQKVYSSVGSDMLVTEHMQVTFKKVVTDDVREDAATLHLPTLIVYGDRDQQTPAAYGEMFHELIKGSKLEILRGADHFIFTEEPGVLIDTTKEFLT